MELDWFQKYVLETAAQANGAVYGLPTHCLCPGCLQPPIQSHSQQAGGALSAIARDGKVIMPSRNFFKTICQGLERGRLEGQFCTATIKSATTFKGFCSKHDTDLFRCIDTRPLSINDENQVLAFHRRAVAYELRNKFEMISFLRAQLGIMLRRGLFPEGWGGELRIHSLLLRGDFDFIWAPLWADNPMQNIGYVWRVIPHGIGVSMTSTISAMTEKHLFTYSNRHIDLQKKTIDRPRPSFTLTIVPEKTQTHIVMAWIRCVEPFIGPFRERMVSKDDRVFAEFLNQCVFCLSEDFCLSPDLWDSIPPETRAVLEEDLHTEDFRSQVVVPDIIKV